MFLGIDLGTSGVKAVLVDETDTVIDHASIPLAVQRPRPLWSEQDPEAWWTAADAAVTALKEKRRAEIGAVQAVGLSGQMHGATLLDSKDAALRPAMLWNDGRSGAECAELERLVPDSPEITGNMAMPGFTAPKLLWVKAHEPEVFASVAKVLLPKDYLRLRMTGDYASDLSDSAGTLWLDVGKREWSPAMLEACDLEEAQMPKLFEGTEPTGRLRAEVARDWGMNAVPVAAGGGDNAAGAVGVGVISPAQAFVSLGTSGVYFVADDTFRPNPSGGVHTFCHCLPGAWHQMAVILSAASCLSWVARLTGAQDVAALLSEIEAAGSIPAADGSSPIFLPYLSGERTPHNDPAAKGVFFGMTHETSRIDLARAVLEGVAFAFADGQDALREAGTRIEEVSVIGGGARSDTWGRILASVLDRPLVYRSGGEMGPAFGAARIARLAVTGEDPSAACAPPPVTNTIEPDPELRDFCAKRLITYRRLYRDLKAAFADSAESGRD